MSDLDFCINQAIQENDIPYKWNEKINQELDTIQSNFKKSREDLTKIPFVTIDGKDAKDFDDAVYCSKEDYGFNLKVAIADVAEIVELETEIDKEAFKRGTSIYFPQKVIPMLPEKISNNICSLIPNEKRNVLVCNIQFDDEGIIQSYNFSESIICSHKRFTYDELDNFKDNAAVFTSLESLKLLTKKRLKNRFDRSALDIETNEPILILNEDGELSDLLISKRLYAHQMIEESMISANICAAKFMKDHYGFGVYRVHEEPDYLKVDALKKFFSMKGLPSNKPVKKLELINSFIRYADKNEDSKLFNVLILQSLKRAYYSTKEIGHFGLQLEKYSHFTSPIRRYPDLITHRLIKNILNKNKHAHNQENCESDLDVLSSLEKRAEIASRQVMQQLICFHLKKFIGDEFSSTVVGVTEFGLFSEISNYFISGLIHVSDLGNDRYILNNDSNALVGKRTGKTYRIGQNIKVKLVNVIPEERKLVLVPVKNDKKYK